MRVKFSFFFILIAFLFLFVKSFPNMGGWMGWQIPKPGPKPPNHPENRFIGPNCTFGVPKSHKTPGWGGWVAGFTDLEKTFPKKTFIFWRLP